jgi:hypothetical protein
MASITWKNGVNGNWSTAGNWVPAVLSGGDTYYDAPSSEETLTGAVFRHSREDR